MIKRIEPSGRPVNTRIHLPGSKSITHRAFLMAALATGESTIINPLRSEDTLLTAGALKSLGVGVQWDGDTAVRVSPPARRWEEPEGPIMLGNSGTSMRLLPAVAATGVGKFIFDGTSRLRERPIGPVADALQGLGVKAFYLADPGYPPIGIESKGLSGGNVSVDASKSSQFLSSLLISAPCAKKDVNVGWKGHVASYPYVALTLAMMAERGIKYKWINDREIHIPAPQTYRHISCTVEGDCSSASYFWAAAAITGGEVYTSPLFSDTTQGDCKLLGVLEDMGCRVQWGDEGVRVQGAGDLSPVDLDMNTIPDMVPTVAILAAFARGRSVIRNVEHLRVKESDRLRAVAVELAKFGVSVEELADGLVIDGGKVLRPRAAIEVYDDHRIAMAFSLMGLCVGGVEINGAECVGKSFPTYWDAFDLLK